MIRIDPLRHQLTSAMLTALARCPIPTRMHSVGRLVLPLGSIPDEDRPQPTAWIRALIRPKVVVPAGARLQCHNYFPPGGGIDWHTDSAQPGWRVYVFRAGVGTSTFHHCDEAVDEGAEGGYVFEAGIGAWHAVESYRDRWSCGMQISEALAREITSA